MKSWLAHVFDTSVPGFERMYLSTRGLLRRGIGARGLRRMVRDGTQDSEPSTTWSRTRNATSSRCSRLAGYSETWRLDHGTGSFADWIRDVAEGDPRRAVEGPNAADGQAQPASQGPAAKHDGPPKVPNGNTGKPKDAGAKPLNQGGATTPSTCTATARLREICSASNTARIAPSPSSQRIR